MNMRFGGGSRSVPRWAALRCSMAGEWRPDRSKLPGASFICCALIRQPVYGFYIDMEGGIIFAILIELNGNFNRKQFA
ncbi:hypothetical protein [Paraburkholderia susongensis]|uniref:hypothetical protein n=1 Tax=Paraburkholderia susongensis TaxID=1515439 RepID=UPI00117C2E4C|nr:hypothetical protein [Paraburkholderia susongensis]